MSKRILIIGGGVSGLSAAYRLCELSRAEKIPLEITVCEAANRLGGVIQTGQQDGFILEGGPDSFISEKPAAFELCRRLGIGGDMIGTNPLYRRSFIYTRGRLRPVPEGFYLMAPADIGSFVRSDLVGPLAMLRMGFEILIPPRRDAGDESVASFVRRRLGQTALEQIAQPMIAGIYSADPERLSLGATMPQFVQLEQRYGSVIRGLWARRKARASEASQKSGGPRYGIFLSLRQGLEALTTRLIACMPEVRFQVSSRILSVEHRPGGWCAELEGGMQMEADGVCLALPAWQSAGLLRKNAAALARLLDQIPYESVATLNAAFCREDIPHALDGFGFVVPSAARRDLIACSFSSIKYSGRAPEGKVLLRAFAGGALHRHVYEMDDEALTALMLRELCSYLGITRPALFMSLRRYDRAMPQFHVGHLNLIRKIRETLNGHPGLFLTGNAYRGIGIPDCIAHAEEVAQAMLTRMGLLKVGQIHAS